MQHMSMPGCIDPVAESQFIGNARSLHHRQGHTPQHHEEQTPEAAQNKMQEGGCGWNQKQDCDWPKWFCSAVFPSVKGRGGGGALKRQIIKIMTRTKLVLFFHGRSFKYKKNTNQINHEHINNLRSYVTGQR